MSVIKQFDPEEAMPIPFGPWMIVKRWVAPTEANAIKLVGNDNPREPHTVEIVAVGEGRRNPITGEWEQPFSVGQYAICDMGMGWQPIPSPGHTGESCIYALCLIDAIVAIRPELPYGAKPQSKKDEPCPN